MTRFSGLAGAAVLLIIVLASNQATCGQQDARALSQEPANQTIDRLEQPNEHIDQGSLLRLTNNKNDYATKSDPKTETETEATKCNEATEFHCQVEDRCVPLEWRCDFTEQCLSGQDELGCVTDWCDFDRDYCYWVHKFQQSAEPQRPVSSKDASQHKSTRSGARHREHEPKTLVRTSYWRRFFPTASRRHQEPNTQVGDLLDSLSLNSAARAKFIFAPLRLDAEDVRALEQRGQNTSKIVKRALIATPQIGRTASQCQLRFEFALWTRALSPHLKSSLSLVAHLANNSRLLWTCSSQELESARGASAIDWTVAVAELGHLNRFELSFEAQLIANLPASGGNGNNGHKPSAASNRRDPRETWLSKKEQQPDINAQTAPTIAMADARQPAEQVAFEGAIVALRWLKFHDCRWPQGASIVASLANSNDFVASELPPESLVPAAVDELEQESCSKEDEFQCSSGICVPKRRLCNFVDDCMSPGGLEDEAKSLCGPLAETSEDFESPSSGSKHMQLFLTGQAEKFWHLNGNWTINRISVASNPIGMSHLPRFDHTGHKPTGRFLSLEVPQLYELGAQSGNQHQRLLWAAINSRWMEKGEREPAEECRLKFFYNLVSSHPGEMYADAAKPPFKFSLVVQHHTVKPRAETPDDLLGLSFDEWGPATKQVDGFIHSHNIEQTRSDKQRPEVIEYPGVDFWREANVRLEHLEPGDLFYIRLLVFVEFTGELRGLQKASINLDDINTHFGCGAALDLAGNKPPQERNFDDELPAMLKPSKQAESVNLLPRYPMRDRLRRSNYNHFLHHSASSADKLSGNQQLSSHRVEAQKLVAYVSGAFLVMMGVIAIIVFVVVPHVERAMMNYQDQIQLSLSGEISDLPISQGTIYDLSAGSSANTQARRPRRPRTWSFGSITTTTGFGSAAAAAASNNKRASQYSIALSTDSSQDGYFEADTSLDHEPIRRPSSATKNLKCEAASELMLAADGLQAKSREQLDEEFNSSAFFCVQDSAGSFNELSGESSLTSSSWQVHSEPLYEPPPAATLSCDNAVGSGSRDRLTNTPDQYTTR